MWRRDRVLLRIRTERRDAVAEWTVDRAVVFWFKLGGAREWVVSGVLAVAGK